MIGIASRTSGMIVYRIAAIDGASVPRMMNSRLPRRSTNRPAHGESRIIGTANIAKVAPIRSRPAPREVRNRLQTTS